jgi:hypothetical protein
MSYGLWGVMELPTHLRKKIIITIDYNFENNKLFHQRKKPAYHLGKLLIKSS